jgi:DNA-binding transcriptional regulator YiaG
VTELKIFRQRYGLTQKAMARLLSTHQPAISLWERGVQRVPDDIADVIIFMLSVRGDES